MINALTRVEDLWQFPGYKAKKLTVRGHDNLWSIRIDDQWRIIFDWAAGHSAASNVEIVDYH